MPFGAGSGAGHGWEIENGLCRMDHMNTILLTIDVEDWFQVENFKSRIPFASWSGRELRVEGNTHRILDLLDRNPSREGPSAATFFVLGWIARKLPGLVREIRDRGHEVASHGYNHHPCHGQTPEALKEDLTASRKLLEDITGEAVTGYRAPSFTVNNEILQIVEASGYRYDSSFNSFDRHGRYGRVDLSGCDRSGIARRLSGDFYEIPVSNINLGDQVFPLGGGGYFRLIPFPLFRAGVEYLLKREDAYLFYLHPWEVDPEQPRVTDIPLSYRFRHYNNLHKTHSRLKRLVGSLGHCRFTTCRRYLHGHYPEGKNDHQH